MDLSLLTNVPVPEGHDIVGDVDPEAGTMTLTCDCGRFSHTVSYRDDAIRAASALADAGRDHLAFVMSLEDK